MGWRARRLSGLGGCPAELEFELVLAVERPCFDAAPAEVGSEFGGITVRGEDAFGLHQFNVAEEVVVTGVVTEWEGSIGAVAEPGGRIEGPAGEDGRARPPDPGKEGRTEDGGWADEDVALDFTEQEFAVVRGEIGVDFAVNLGEGERGGMEHGGHPGAQEFPEDFLGLAQGIREQDGNGAVRQGLGTEIEDLRHGALGGWELEVREAEGGLHRQGFSREPLGGLAGRVWAEGKVAGVEEGTGIVLEVELRGAGDVSCGEELEDCVLVGVRGEERECGVVEGGREADLEEPDRVWGGENVGVRSDVIGVGVGNEREIAGIPGVEPEVLGREMDAAVCEGVDHGWRRSIDTFAGAGVVWRQVMNRIVYVVALAVCLFKVEPGRAKEPARRLDRAEVLPLALDDAIRFQKTKHFLNERTMNGQSGVNRMLSFERQHRNYGAVTNADLRERYGNYYTFFWRTDRVADVTVRFEYRLEKLGNFVQAIERTHTAAKGNQQSSFEVIGDEHLQDGRVTAWRALIIEDGKVVALSQSFLWN